MNLPVLLVEADPRCARVDSTARNCTLSSPPSGPIPAEVRHCACPFTPGYWAFTHRHADMLAANMHRPCRVVDEAVTDLDAVLEQERTANATDHRLKRCA